MGLAEPSPCSQILEIFDLRRQYGKASTEGQSTLLTAQLFRSVSGYSVVLDATVVLRHF